MPDGNAPGAPRVFVSHASEDKERFVLDLATRLRAKGIDAWLDKWEILPGDSLVDKIFEEGLKNADAVIVVVSATSVTKPWVREELNAGVVKRIGKSARLIPVVIDDCDVPEALKSTVWVRVKDVTSYDAQLDEIVRAIFGQKEKPALGNPPAYVGSRVATVPGLTREDSLVLKMAGDKAVEQGHPHIQEPAAEHDLAADSLRESLDILDHRGYIKGNRYIGGEGVVMPHFTMTPLGFEAYAQAFVEEYAHLMDKVGYHLTNHDRADSMTIATALDVPLRLVDHILEWFQAQGLLKGFQPDGGPIIVLSVLPELRRRLRA
jgi:hypothetical protein